MTPSKRSNNAGPKECSININILNNYIFLICNIFIVYVNIILLV